MTSTVHDVCDNHAESLISSTLSPRTGIINLFFNDSLPAITASNITSSPLSPLIILTKNKDVMFQFRSSVVSTRSPTQLEITISPLEFLQISGLAFQHFFVFSTLSISVANGPFVPMTFSCMVKRPSCRDY